MLREHRGKTLVVGGVKILSQNQRGTEVSAQPMLPNRLSVLASKQYSKPSSTTV
jgi:hypothetical protein